MNVEEASKLFNLLSDPNRLEIVLYLRKNLHANATEILNVVACKQATLSHHLNSLSEEGLVTSKKKGNQVIYSLSAPKFNQLVSFLGTIDRINRKEEKPIRVIETPIIKKVETKKRKNSDMPTFLL